MQTGILPYVSVTVRPFVSFFPPQTMLLIFFILKGVWVGGARGGGGGGGGESKYAQWNSMQFILKVIQLIHQEWSPVNSAQLKRRTGKHLHYSVLPFPCLPPTLATIGSLSHSSGVYVFPRPQVHFPNCTDGLPFALILLR